MTRCWYVLRVKPHKERTVDESLRVRAVTVYFPTVKVQPSNQRAVQIRPYFPGYLFLRANLEEVGINAFNWLPGVHGLVAFGNIPAIVPDNLIYELQHRIGQIETQQALWSPNSYRKGDQVHINSGPFAGYNAIFDTYLPGSTRVQVLLAFLSQHPQPIKLDASHLNER